MIWRMVCAPLLFFSEVCGLLSMFRSERMDLIADMVAWLGMIHAIVMHIEEAVGNKWEELANPTSSEPPQGSKILLKRD